MRMKNTPIIYFFRIAAFSLLALLPVGAAYAEASSQNSVFTGEYDSLETLFTLYQPYLENISAYEPIYFLEGINPEKSKFQISFKYRLLGTEAPLVKEHEWLQGVFLGYTQTSFWDLAAASQPFEDTSYKPELFFISSDVYASEKKDVKIFLQQGIKHESNGQGDNASRSTNTAYFKPMAIYYNEDSKFGIQIAPKAWVYFENDDTTNPDIEHYRGYFDLELKVGKADALVVETHFQPASEGNSVRVDATYPMDRYLKGNFDIYLHVQYVNALGESFRDYKERVDAVRIGFSIIR